MFLYLPFKTFTTMTTISQQVGQRLRNLRLSMGIKQEVMAENLKMTAPTYAKYEKGKPYPSIQFLHACANIFKIPVAQILDLDNADLWGDFSVNKTYAQQDTIYRFRHKNFGCAFSY